MGVTSKTTAANVLRTSEQRVKLYITIRAGFCIEVAIRAKRAHRFLKQLIAEKKTDQRGKTIKAKYLEVKLQDMKVVKISGV